MVVPGPETGPHWGLCQMQRAQVLGTELELKQESQTQEKQTQCDWLRSLEVEGGLEAGA